MLNKNGRVVQVETKRKEKVRTKVKEFLKTNHDVMAYNDIEMPKLNPDVIVYKLNVKKKKETLTNKTKKEKLRSRKKGDNPRRDEQIKRSRVH